MITTLKQMMPKIETWSPTDQEALAEYAREIEADRTGVYTMTDDEAQAVNEGLAQADRGEYVSEEKMAALWKRFAAV